MSEARVGTLVLVATVDRRHRNPLVILKRITGERIECPWTLRPDGQVKASIIKAHGESMVGIPVSLCDPSGILYSDDFVFSALASTRTRSRSR